MASVVAALATALWTMAVGVADDGGDGGSMPSPGVGRATPPGPYVGKLERELAERLASGRGIGAGRVNVVYMLRMPPGSGRDAEGVPRLEALAARLVERNERMAERLLRAGHRIRYRSPYAGMVVAEAPAQAIRAMEADPDVERVYLERINEPRLNVSRVVSQADIVNGRGISGSGARVGVVEAGRIGGHANLPSGQRILCRGSASSSISGHKTNVAGVIQSTSSSHRGMAPTIAIIDGVAANFSDAQLMAATDCVISQGAVAVNMSFGADTNGAFTAFARYVDRVAHNTGRTIVVAASNNCANRIGSPEIAFNALGVGSYSDRNTTSGSDDRHSCDSAISPAHSAYRNPPSPSGDREEPKMVAPGHLINTTNSSGGFSNVNGTSFAAPHVVGVVGLLRQRRPALQSQGELVRAILMASARKNVEGAARLSDRDGAGALQAAAADRVLLNNQAWFYTTSGAASGFPLSQAFSASAGQRVRVVVVWSHKATDNSATRPSTDLDLVVRSPSGSTVGSSTSRDNTYEIVEFTAPVTGTYTARIANVRASSGSEHIGLAVSRQSS